MTLASTYFFIILILLMIILLKDFYLGFLAYKKEEKKALIGKQASFEAIESVFLANTIIVLIILYMKVLGVDTSLYFPKMFEEMISDINLNIFVLSSLSFLFANRLKNILINLILKLESIKVEMTEDLNL